MTHEGKGWWKSTGEQAQRFLDLPRLLHNLGIIAEHLIIVVVLILAEKFLGWLIHQVLPSKYWDMVEDICFWLFISQLTIFGVACIAFIIKIQWKALNGTYIPHEASTHE